MVPIQLQKQDLEDIIYGSAFLGSGGGGPVSMACKLLDAFDDTPFPCQIMGVNEFADDAMVAVVAGMGSPAQASQISQPFTNAPQTAVKMLQQQSGKVLAATVPIEVGPMNSLIPLLVSAQLNLPVLDADGGGRAFSTLAMASFNLLAGVNPYILCNDVQPDKQADFVGASLMVDNADMADAISRGIVEEPSFQGAGACSSFLMSGEQVKQCAVTGGLQRALALGKLLRPYREVGADPLDAVLTFFADQAVLLFTGVLRSVSQSTSGALDVGVMQLHDGERDFTVYNLNENLIAWDDSHSSPVIQAPDSICIMAENGQTFTNASIQDHIGQRLHVVGVKAAPLTQTPNRLLK